MPDETGVNEPHVSAIFCERVLDEKDGMLSAIRIMDGVTVQIPAELPPDFQIPVEASVVILVRGGPSPAEYDVRLGYETPSGKRVRPQVGHHLVIPENKVGGNVIVHARFAAEEEGLHWFFVYLNDRTSAKIPLLVSIDRIDMTVPIPPASPASSQDSLSE